MPSPDPLPDSFRVAESTQYGPHADPVEALVAAERRHDWAEGQRRRGGGVTEAEVLPQRVVVARESAPQAAHARRGPQGGTVESSKDFHEDVNVVVYEELVSFLLFLSLSRACASSLVLQTQVFVVMVMVVVVVHHRLERIESGERCCVVGLKREYGGEHGWV